MLGSKLILVLFGVGLSAVLIALYTRKYSTDLTATIEQSPLLPAAQPIQKAHMSHVYSHHHMQQSEKSGACVNSELATANDTTEKNQQLNLEFPELSQATNHYNAVCAHRSPLLRLQLESNESQSILLDSFTTLVSKTEILACQITSAKERYCRDHQNRIATTAEQQRKWLTADARLWEQNKKWNLETQRRRSAEKLAREQMGKLSNKQQSLENQQSELERSRAIASFAAKLARRAANSEKQANQRAEQELIRRQKFESQTHRAMQIARNAINALEKEEKKNKAYSG